MMKCSLLNPYINKNISYNNISCFHSLQNNETIFILRTCGAEFVGNLNYYKHDHIRFNVILII